MSIRKKNELQMQRLEKLSFTLEQKELEQEERQKELDKLKSELAERELNQKKREEEFFNTWHSASGEKTINTADDIMLNLRKVMEEYSSGIFNIRRQIDIMTAACNNAASRIVEGGSRNGSEVYNEEIGNALYASYIDRREFEDITNDNILEHSLVSIASVEELKRVGNYGFRNNVLIRKVELPEGIKEILPSFFFGCSQLTEVYLPDSVEKIGEYSFYGCTSLKTIHIGENSKLNEIGEYAFALTTDLESFSIPDSVNSIGMGAFRGCSALSDVIWPKEDGLDSIGSHLFQNCKSLIEVELPESINEIPTSMFFGCSSLLTVIAENVIKVGAYSFSGSRAIKTVRLGKNVEIDPLAFDDTNDSFELIYEKEDIAEDIAESSE